MLASGAQLQEAGVQESWHRLLLFAKKMANWLAPMRQGYEMLIPLLSTSFSVTQSSGMQGGDRDLR
jgi:hypothetical protein